LKIVGKLIVVEYRTEEAGTKLGVLSWHLILFLNDDSDSSCDASHLQRFLKRLKTLGIFPPFAEASSQNWPWCCWGKLGYSNCSCIDAYWRSAIVSNILATSGDRHLSKNT
jgi:hypothetical protein